jgi:uncharacterized protein
MGTNLRGVETLARAGMIGESMVQSLASRWRRRAWRADPVELAAFAGLRPVTIITGASEGIGAAFAARLAFQHQALLLVARDGARLERVAAKLRRSDGPPIAILSLDLTQADAPQALDRALTGMGGYADMLINNAGVGISGAFAETKPNEIEALISLNVSALTRLARHVLPGMLVRGRGGILFIASLAAYTPGPWQAVYYASKSYVLSLSEALATETAGMGVRVCCCAPGPVETGFHRKMGSEHAVYRWAMPSQTAERVAAVALFGYRLGARVLTPGVLTAGLALCLRLLPHRLTLPVINVLLNPHNAQRKNRSA